MTLARVALAFCSLIALKRAGINSNFIAGRRKKGMRGFDFRQEMSCLESLVPTA
jgi:hypothetical protein